MDSNNNNNNSNPFGLNLANTSMSNVMFSYGSNIKRGNVDIRSVYDPSAAASANGNPVIKNSTFDIQTTKVEGDVKMHEIPIVPTMSIQRTGSSSQPTIGQVKPALPSIAAPVPPVPVNRMPSIQSVPSSSSQAQNPTQSSNISSSQVSFKHL